MSMYRQVETLRMEKTNLSRDQRTKVRKDEIFTLTQVIQVMEGAVSEKTTAATIRFNQQGTSVRLAQAVARDSGSMNALEAEAESTEDADAAPVSFLQARQLRGTADPREKIASLLRSS